MHLSRRAWLIIGGATVLAAVSIPLAFSRKQPPKVEVPRVVGMSLQKAEHSLLGRGLVLDATRSGCHRLDTADRTGLGIAGQRPPAGTIVSAGDPVYVNLSLHNSWCSWRRPNASPILGLLPFAWIGSVIFVWLDATRRGERGWLWGIGAFAFWIIVVPIWLLVRTTRPVIRTTGESSQQYDPPHSGSGF